MKFSFTYTQNKGCLMGHTWHYQVEIFRIILSFENEAGSIKEEITEAIEFFVFHILLLPITYDSEQVFDRLRLQIMFNDIFPYLLESR